MKYVAISMLIAAALVSGAVSPTQSAEGGKVDFDQLRQENLEKSGKVDFDQLRRENRDKGVVDIDS